MRLERMTSRMRREGRRDRCLEEVGDRAVRRVRDVDKNSPLPKRAHEGPTLAAESAIAAAIVGAGSHPVRAHPEGATEGDARLRQAIEPRRVVFDGIGALDP